MSRVLWTLTAICAATVLGGCRSTPPDEQVVLTPQFRFEDVPVHPRLKLDVNESFIFETQTLKAGILVYHGKQRVEEVVDFFKTEMPKHAWRLINAVEARGVVALNFDKEGWSALVRVTRGGLSTDVEITIGPKQNGRRSPPRGPGPKG